MYAITGITGQVGSAVANALLAQGKPVRAAVRDSRKADAWRARGCDIATADMGDTAALTAAFTGVAGVFVLLPPIFDPSPDFAEMKAIIQSLVTALEKAQPSRVVCLSTIGAQATQSNLLNQLGLAEQTLRELSMPVAFLRAAWFMENALWDVASAHDEGVVHSFLQPLDKPVPMVATQDIGTLGAQLLQETWRGARVAELEGPRHYSPNDIADAFAKALGRDVHAGAVAHDTWHERFSAQGMNNPEARIQMLNGFNEGWIRFETGETHIRRGTTELQTVIDELVARALFGYVSMDA